MKIRFATLEDLDFITQGLRETHIIEKWPQENLVPEQEVEEAKNSLNQNEIRIIEQSNQPIGFIWVEPNFRAMHLDRDNYLWVHLIFVIEEYRRKGVAKLLHEDAEKTAKKLGRNELMLDIFEVNKASEKFFKKL